MGSALRVLQLLVKPLAKIQHYDSFTWAVVVPVLALQVGWPEVCKITLAALKFSRFKITP